MPFKILKQSKATQARLGRLKTAHGEIQTPVFMPIATKAAVKNLTAEEIQDLGAQIILSNTFHLYLQPGLKVLKKAGGLHGLMNWSGPILTDSGGFQVFSLAKIRKILRGGVEFRSPLDGSKHLFTPKKVLQIQKIIGSDIAMILDVCPPSTASRQEVARAVEATTKWARIAAKIVESRKSIKPARNTSRSDAGGSKVNTVKKSKKQFHFAIIQGGIYQDLRLESLKDLVALNFDGYAIGGLAVGETRQEMYAVLDYLVPQMPIDKPRYLMGVGTPENIVSAVRRGVDMFDCVIPTREARHGRLYLRVESRKSIKSKVANPFAYKTVNITNARYRHDFSSINNTNLRHYTKAYLYHLFKTGEPLGMRLATLNNLDFYLTLMREIRSAIKQGKL